ncbi:hypothetical protein [Paraburkholderia caledonica]|uniref:Uncharacterized protein n=1 Tax=Paraburkholderia caledonica TaxID=134536 RepID=A0AB73I848_9BURK|nr:hypothetical protein [Paraburkholderia caledonica]
MNEREGPESGVTVDRGMSSDRSPSLQVWQEAWYKLTGKTEEVSRSWNAPFQIGLGHLQSLHKRLEQCCEQYAISASNFEIVVFYADDHSERFTSWQRFNTHAPVDTAAVESVQLTYDFLITPPKTQTPQNYRITLQIASKVSVMRKLHADSFFFGPMPKIIRQIGNRTAEARIKYVDYVIARTMLHTIDEWAKSLPRASEPAAFRWLERRSHIVPPIFRSAMAVVTIACVIEAISHVLGESATIPKLAYFLVTAFACIFASYGIGHYIGRLVENALDKYCALSYLELTAGDTNAIKAARQDNKGALAFSVGGTVTALVLSTLSRFAAAWLLHLVIR